MKAALTWYSDGGACAYPTGVVAETDAANPGCFAHVPGRICEVSNGAIVTLDGGVLDGTESCSSLCGASQYEMTCQFTNAAPDPSLGCTIIPADAVRRAVLLLPVWGIAIHRGPAFRVRR